MRPLPTALLLLLLFAAACTTTRPGPDTPPGPDEPPVVDPLPAAPPGYRLALADRQPRAEPLALPGVTGQNKQPDLALRFRRQVPDDTPAFVPRERDGLALFVADPTPEGWLAFYKGRCGGLGDVCAYRAALFDTTGATVWDLDLNVFFSLDRHVDVQDVRLHDGKLYFNEACQSYAREAGGQCSSLLRVDPAQGTVDWRTPPLTSNDVFVLHDPYVVAGYGFTDEPDSLYLVDQATGAIAQRVGIDSAHDYLEVQGDRLFVVTYDSVYTFAIEPLE